MPRKTANPKTDTVKKTTRKKKVEEALEKVAEGQSTKIVVPSDIANVTGLLASLKETLANNEKSEKVETKKVEKKIRQKILVEEGGRMNSDIPYKVIYSEFVESAPAAKERIKELKLQYPNNSICYFSV